MNPSHNFDNLISDFLLYLMILPSSDHFNFLISECLRVLEIKNFDLLHQKKNKRSVLWWYKPFTLPFKWVNNKSLSGCLLLLSVKL